MKTFKIFLLGNPQVYVNKENINDKLSSKALALLLYLAANRGKKFSRDKLAEMFWGESGYESSSYNLRYNLWALKKVIDDNSNSEKLIISDKNSISINPNVDCYIDIDEYTDFDFNIENTGIDKLIFLKNLYRGNFLESFIIKKCFDFNDWIFFEREKYQRIYFKVLDNLLNRYSKNEDFQNSIELLNEMIKINPLNEDLYEQLIRNYLKIGDRNRAMHVYKKCISTLREELNISPKESFKLLYNEICDNSGIQKKRIKLESKIYYLNHEKFCNVKDSISDGEETLISLSCYPLNNLNYYFLSSLLETIISNIPEKILKGIPVDYWNFVAILSAEAPQYSDNSKCVFSGLSENLEKNVIFNGLMHFLDKVSSEIRLIIFVENFHWIDDISFEFIRYYLFNNQSFDGKFIIYGEENSNILKLERYFKIEKDI